MKPLFCLLLTILYTFCIYGQQSKNETIDSLFAEYDKKDVPGFALGVIKDGKFLYKRGYGMANLEYDVPISTQSVFRIASTSKQFTAACILILEEQGKLSLNDNLRNYFPDFPDYAGKIKISHLLHHTSGIRDYLLLSYLKGLDDEDYYTDEEVMEWLIRQEELNFQTGDEFVYSNSGYWLLGQIVNKVSGMDMAEFAEKEIFGPLKMENTFFAKDHTQIIKNRAVGYSPNTKDGYSIYGTTLEMIGDGGVYTTIEDIKKWDDAFYHSEILDKEFWGKMTQVGLLNNGEENQYAAGLFIGKYKGLKTISHGGAFVGYRAELLRFPEQAFTVAVFANRSDANPSRIAYQLADIYLKDEFMEEDGSVEVDKPLVEVPRDSIEYSKEQLYGDYEIEPGVVLNVGSKNDSLYITQKWNNASYAIIKAEGNTYQIPNVPNLSFSFSKLENNSANELTIVQDGHKSLSKRKISVDLSSIDFKKYVGEYYSKELDITYSVLMENDSLYLKIRNADPALLQASDIDQFFCQGLALSFHCENDVVSGFELDAGRVKNLGFEKY